MNGNSFGHDFAHALTARSVDDEYRQIDRLYGPRGRSWQFVQQALSMEPLRPDIAAFLGPDGVQACQQGGDALDRWVRDNIGRIGPQGSIGLCSNRRYDVVTIRLANGETRRVHFDITSFVGKWPDHAAGRILPGAEMQASEITGAGQAASSGPTSHLASLAFVGLAGFAAFGLGRMAGYRGVYRSNPCGCRHGSSG